MKHPKKCDGCRALFQSQTMFTCELGYELSKRIVGTIEGTDILNVSPKLGKCPKPLTDREFTEAVLQKGGES